MEFAGIRGALSTWIGEMGICVGKCVLPLNSSEVSRGNKCEIDRTVVRPDEKRTRAVSARPSPFRYISKISAKRQREGGMLVSLTRTSSPLWGSRELLDWDGSDLCLILREVK